MAITFFPIPEFQICSAVGPELSITFPTCPVFPINNIHTILAGNYRGIIVRLTVIITTIAKLPGHQW